MMPRHSDNPPQHTQRDLVPGFASLVRAAREGKGWNRTKLAIESGVSLTTVCSVEKETRAPSLRVASQLAKALDLAVLLEAPAEPNKLRRLLKTYAQPVTPIAAGS